MPVLSSIQLMKRKALHTPFHFLFERRFFILFILLEADPSHLNNRIAKSIERKSISLDIAGVVRTLWGHGYNRNEWSFQFKYYYVFFLLGEM